MEAVQEIQAIGQVPTQLSESARDVGDWVVRLFDDVIFLLAALAAHDNRWDS